MGLFQGRVILERALVTESDGIDEHMGDDWILPSLSCSQTKSQCWGKSQVLLYLHSSIKIFEVKLYRIYKLVNQVLLLSFMLNHIIFWKWFSLTMFDWTYIKEITCILIKTSQTFLKNQIYIFSFLFRIN